MVLNMQMRATVHAEHYDSLLKDARCLALASKNRILLIYSNITRMVLMLAAETCLSNAPAECFMTHNTKEKDLRLNNQCVW